MAALGGMIGPILAADATTPAAKSTPYSFFMAGIRVADSADASPTAVPLTPARIMPDRVVIWASPPRMWPTTDWQKAINRSRIPVESISSPAIINRGIAIRGKELTELSIRSGIMRSDRSPVNRMAKKALIPRHTATGIPNTSVMTKTIPMMVIMLSPPSSFSG